MTHVGPNATGANTLGKGAAPAAPTPGSIQADAVAALAAFAGEQRLIGGLQAHEAFEGILTELVASLVETRDMLITALGAAGRWENIRPALDRLDQEINYVRALGAVTDEEVTPDGD